MTLDRRVLNDRWNPSKKEQQKLDWKFFCYAFFWLCPPCLFPATQILHVRFQHAHAFLTGTDIQQNLHLSSPFLVWSHSHSGTISLSLPLEKCL